MAEMITEETQPMMDTTVETTLPIKGVKKGKVVSKTDQTRRVSTKKREVEQLSKWQTKLLPLMTWMIVGLASFFFIASLFQLAYLNRSILETPKMDILISFQDLEVDDNTSTEQMMNIAYLKARTILEANATERLYHQANVLLMSRVWIRYMGFVTGMVLALVGSTFILGKLREPVSEIETKTSLSSLSLRSASPGLILATLGVILMLTTIIVNHNITVTDRPLYFQEELVPPTTFEESATPPPVDPFNFDTSQDGIQKEQNSP